MKVLVAYATRAGSTAEVATEIGWVRLESANGCVVDGRPIAEI